MMLRFALVSAAALLALSSSTSFAKGPATAAPAATAATAGTCTTIPLAAANAAFVRTASAANAWGGPRAASAATLSDRVVAYSIDAALDPDKHTVTGKQ
ncbi:MAG: M1 family peptidase, partial [Proteobacteria bacterium]|nr:M1 family peptidase [Pseudomonadota bacterium]